MHTTVTTINRSRLSTLLGRTAAVTLFAAAGTLGLHAQQSAGTASSLPALNLKTSLAAPLDLSSSSSLSTPDGLGYSSSVGAAETANAELFSLDEGGQPPPRRRYSRPNYNDSRTNPDGSPKYDFFAGGGFGVPTGGTHNYLTTGWGLQFGGGRNFNKKFALNAQFDYDHFGFQTGTLNNLLAIYQAIGVEDGYGDGEIISQLGGSSHLWSFTVDPKYTFFDSDTYGAYVVAGVGFYHKTANFTTPSVGEYCEFYGCFEYAANATVDKYTSNAPGFNAGFGMTYKFSRFASQRLYGEVRYVFVDNQPRAFSFGDLSGDHYNYFPQNSHRTTYIPVKFGIRF
jgi:hypothetical protein